MCTCDSFTVGGSTTSAGLGVRPPASKSSTSGGNSADVIFICCANSSDTVFTTNSRVTVMLCSVSFRGRGPRRRIGQKQITGGLALTPVKKLKGARFGIPSGLKVDTNAMGRGTIAPISSLYVSSQPASFGSTINQRVSTGFFSIQLIQYSFHSTPSPAGKT